MNRKKIIRVETLQYAPETEKVYYEDGGIGFRYKNKSETEIDNSIPDQGRDGNPIAWGESKEAAPSSPNEISEIESQLDDLRGLSRDRLGDTRLVEKYLKSNDPASVMRETEIRPTSLPLKGR